MTQAHREDLQAIPLVKSVIQDLRATKNRQTRIFQFNGILFKVVQVVQNKIEAYPFLGYKVILNRSAQVQVIYGWYSTWLLLSSL